MGVMDEDGRDGKEERGGEGSHLASVLASSGNNWHRVRSQSCTHLAAAALPAPLNLFFTFYSCIC